MGRLVAIIMVFASVALSTASAASLSKADRRDVARIEAYLNRMQSVEASFLQYSSSGQSAEGRLYLQRPGQLRLDYRPPATLQIYADGFWLIYVDTELEEVTHLPLNSTPAGFLVREHVRLSGDVTVTRLERGTKSLRVYIAQTEEPDAGHIVLTLSDGPLRLRNWSVIDAQGVETRVSLIDPAFNAEIAEKVFEFDETAYEPRQVE